MRSIGEIMREKDKLIDKLHHLEELKLNHTKEYSALLHTLSELYDEEENYNAYSDARSE